MAWNSYMEAAFALYGLTPEVFWGMTLTEFTAMERGRMKMSGWIEPLTVEELEEMMRKFPDT